MDDPSGVHRTVGGETDRPAQFLETGSRESGKVKAKGNTAAQSKRHGDKDIKSDNNSDGDRDVKFSGDHNEKRGFKSRRSRTKDNDDPPINPRRNLRGLDTKIMAEYGRLEREYRDRQLKLNKQI